MILQLLKQEKLKINIPLAGSEANACTEVSRPDLTINVPNKVNEKDKMAKRIVQLFNLSLFSVTLTECKRAVVNKPRNKDTFSTGSQNHHPPQPNS